MFKINFCNRKPVHFHVLSHVRIIKIRLDLASLLTPAHTLLHCKTRRERARRRLNCYLFGLFQTKNLKIHLWKPEPRAAVHGNCQTRHPSAVCRVSSHGNVMLFDEVVVPELRFVALFTKCLTFGMLLCVSE